MRKKVLFLFPYPCGESPSQRFRFEQYLDLLREHNIEFVLSPFFQGSQWRMIYSSKHYFEKFRLLAGGILRRLGMLFTLLQYDFVFIHREALPFGPPVIEWLIAKVFRKKIIYDFDDAIWTTDKTNESLLSRVIKWRRKVGTIARWSYRVSSGNEYLCNYARSFTASEKVILNPTTIETDEDYNRELHRIEKNPQRVIIGWTGSRSTLKYMREQMPVLRRIVGRYPHVDVLVIADQDDGLNPERFYFRKWSEATEISDLLLMDIGIMPLPDDLWAQGKCGLKALQYMALEIPSVISPVGVNQVIIQHGINGFLCNSPEEWFQTLSILIENEALRRKTGSAGRDTVVDSYSVNANAAVFLSLFQE
jgi:glycosyltransferase involved in cell wall biosynthesis